MVLDFGLVLWELLGVGTGRSLKCKFLPGFLSMAMETQEAKVLIDNSHPFLWNSVIKGPSVWSG